MSGNNNFIRSYPLSDNNPGSSWMNKFIRNANSQNIIAGNGIDINYGSNSATISIDGDTNQKAMDFKGNYDFDSAYSIGDTVNIPYDSLFQDQDGNTIPIGSTTNAGYSICPTAIGTYVCIKNIPPSYMTEDYYNDNLASQFNNVPSYIMETTRYYNLNTYYPQYPSPPNQYTASVSVYNTNYNITANDTFWQPIGIPAVPVNNCINGVASTFYISAIMSGSLYQTDYLAYQDNLP